MAMRTRSDFWCARRYLSGDRQRLSRARDGQHLVEVDAVAHRRGDAHDPRLGSTCLRRRGQAEMALAHRQPVVAPQAAEHGDVAIALDRGDQLALVPRPRDLVDDDAGDPHRRVEHAIAHQQRRDAARDALGIDHQHHRRADQLGQRRVAVAAFEIDAVVQPLVAFDQRHIDATRPRRDHRRDLRAVLRIEIEVEARPPRRAAEPHRVDVVGALLERLHGKAAFRQRPADADRHGRLARRLVRGGDQDAGSWNGCAHDSTAPVTGALVRRTMPTVKVGYDSSQASSARGPVAMLKVDRTLRRWIMSASRRRPAWSAGCAARARPPA